MPFFLAARQSALGPTAPSPWIQAESLLPDERRHTRKSCSPGRVPCFHSLSPTGLLVYPHPFTVFPFQHKANSHLLRRQPRRRSAKKPCLPVLHHGRTGSTPALVPGYRRVQSVTGPKTALHDACLGSTGKPACLSRKRRIHDACPAETGDPNRPTAFQKRPYTTTADHTRNPDTKGPPKRAVASAGYAAVPWQHFSRRHRAVPMRMALGGIGQRRRQEPPAAPLLPQNILSRVRTGYMHFCASGTHKKSSRTHLRTSAGALDTL